MKRDSDATRRRILAASAKEFAARGLAGARVDRIAADAQANKKLVYEHFGSKEELFDLVIEDQLSRLRAALEPADEDLERYAERLFDLTYDHPELIRLATWRSLERTSPLLPPGSVLAANTRLRGEDQPGSRPPLPNHAIPARVVVDLVVAIATAWSAANPLRCAAGKRTRARRAEYRRSIGIAVRAIFAAGTGE